MSLSGAALKRATFGLGCFWGCDSLFGSTPGVIRTAVGYCGGTLVNPTYHNLGDHTEAINIDYDPNVTSYGKLLQIFWSKHDPTSVFKTQYMSVIFYHDNDEKAMAEETAQAKGKQINAKVVTKIVPYKDFYNAEDYHQKYYLQTFHTAVFKKVCSSNEDLLISTAAAKLNGYVSGNGSVEAFNKERESFGLSAELEDYVRAQIKKPSHKACH